MMTLPARSGIFSTENFFLNGSIPAYKVQAITGKTSMVIFNVRTPQCLVD